MFKNVADSKRFREGLPNHKVGSFSKGGAARKRQRKQYFDGPFAPFGMHTDVPHDDVTPLDDRHLSALAHASQHVAVQAHIGIIINQLFQNLVVLRGDELVSFKPDFKQYFVEIFAPLARQVANSLLVYGIAPVIVSPPRRGASRGVRALQRSDFTAKLSGRAGPFDTIGTPLVVNLGDIDNFTLQFTAVDGVKEYELVSDSLSKEALGSLMVSIVHQPTADGLCQGPLAGVLPKLALFEAYQTISLSVEEENSNPVNLLQQRHGPSSSQPGVGGVDPASLFFDREALQVHKDSEKQGMERLIELVAELNRRQTTIAPDPNENKTKTRVGDVEVQRSEPRFSLIPIGLESATHSRYASCSSLNHVTEAGQTLFEQIGVLFSVPRGLTTGVGSSVSGAGPQKELFDSMLETLRGTVETVLTAVYSQMFGVYDQHVKLVKFNPRCQDIDSIQALYAAGLLETATAQRLAAEAMGIDAACAAPKSDVNSRAEDDDGASSTLQLE